MINCYRFVLATLFFACIAFPRISFGQCGNCSIPGPNLIINGNFEFANLFYASGYTYSPLLTVENNFYTGPDASVFNPAFQGTGRTANFMMVNGGSTVMFVFCEDITVNPNTSYTFSAWVSSLNLQNTAKLQFMINGVALGPVFSAPSALNTWEQHSESWSSGSATMAQVCIISRSTLSGGNDFGLDDISFNTCTPVERQGGATNLGPDQYYCSSANFNLVPQDTTIGGVLPNQYSDSSGTVYYENNSDSVVTFALVSSGLGAYAGCVESDTVKITVYPPLNPDLGPDRRVCNQPVTLSNNIVCDSIRWNTGATTQSITVNQSGTYIATVYRWSCSDADTVNVIIDTVPVFDLPTQIDLCTGQDTLITSPFNAPWSTGVTAYSIRVNSAGTYTQTVTNGSCTYSDSTRVRMFTYPVVNLGPDTLKCDGTPVNYTIPTAGTWQDNSFRNNYTAATSGLYWVRVVNGPCATTDSVQVVIKDIYPKGVVDSTHNCTTGPTPLSFTYSGTPTFLWSTGATTPSISVNTSGTYWVELRDTTCFASATMEVLYHIPPTVVMPATVKICQGTSTTLGVAPTPGETYSWNPGGMTTSTRTANTSGSYTLTAKNAFCTTTGTTVLTVINVVKPTWLADTTICETDSLRLTGTALAGYTNTWNTGATTSSITVKTPGFYKVVITNDICQDSVSTNLHTDSAIVFTLPPSAKLCPGDSVILDGPVKPGYIYSWNTGATTSSIVAKTGGNKILTVSKGKCSTRDTTVVTQIPLTLPVWPTDTSICSIDSVRLIGGTAAGHTNLWSTGATSSSIYVKTAGTYSVTIQNDICIDSLKINLRVDSSINLNLPATAKICPGDSVTISTSVVPGYTYTWNTGATGSSIVAKTAGNKILTAKLGKCTSIDTTVVTVVPFAVPTWPTDTSICLGDSVRLFGATAAGHTNLWSTGATTSSIYVKTAGTYSVFVQNDICSTTLSINLRVDSTVNINLPTTEKICSGDSVIISAPSVPGYSYLWNNGATSNSIVAKTAGNKIVTVTFGKCVGRDTTVVTVLAVPVATLPATASFCENDSLLLTGSMVAAYKNSWSTGDSSQSITVTTEGTYKLIVSNDICEDSANTVVTKKPLPESLLPDYVAFCTGNVMYIVADTIPGSVTVTWNTGQTGDSIQITSVGTYIATLTLNGCSIQDTIIATNDINSILTLPDTTKLCEGSSTVLSVGIFPGFTYVWNTGDSVNPLTVDSTGLYIVSASNGSCIGYDTTLVISVQVPVAVLPGSMTICDTDSATLFGSDTATYVNSWSTGEIADSIVIKSAGVYQLIVTNDVCSDTASTVLNVDISPISGLPDSVVICSANGRPVSVTNDAMVKVLWNTGDTLPNITLTDTGTFSVRLVKGLCTVFDTIISLTDTLPVLSLIDSSQICQGSSVNLTYTPKPNFNFTWNTGQVNSGILADTTGLYILTATNIVDSQCSISDSSFVSVVEVPVLSLTDTIHFCDGDSAILNGSTLAGYINHWSTGETSAAITVYTSGTYLVIAENGLCSVSDQSTIVVDSVPTSLLADVAIICNGAPVTLTATDNLLAIVSWGTGQTTNSIVVSSPGTYSVNVSDGTCGFSDSILVATDVASILGLPDTSKVCSGDSVTLSVPLIAGFSYAWNTGGSGTSIKVADAGKYFVTVSNGTCSGSDTTRLIEIAKPFRVLPSSHIICETDSALLIGSLAPNHSNRWSTGATNDSIYVNLAGTYYLQISNDICSVTDSSNVIVATNPVVSLPSNASVCENSSITLTGTSSAGYSNTWSTGETTQSISVNSAGNYFVDMTNGICSVHQDVVVTVDQLPIGTLADSANYCANQPGTLTATSSAYTSIIWNNGDTTLSILASTPGNYLAQITNGSCVVSDSCLVSITYSPIPNLIDSIRFCEGTDTSITVIQIPGWAYMWSIGATSPTVIINQPGLIYLTADNGKCLFSDSTLANTNPFPTSLLDDNYEICETDSITLNPGNQNVDTYRWSTGHFTPTIAVSDSGFYSVILNNDGCLTYDTTYLTLQTKPIITLAPSGRICSNDTFLLSATLDNPYPVSWSNGSTGLSQMVNQAGVYTLTAKNGGCEVSDSLVLSVDIMPNNALPSDTTFCQGLGIDLHATDSAFTSVRWNTPTNDSTNEITLYNPGLYLATVTSGVCSFVSFITLKMDSMPVPTLLDTSNFCAGGAIVLRHTPKPGETILWSTGSTASTLAVNAPAKVTLTVTKGSCVAYDSTEVIQLEYPVSNLLDSNFCIADSLLLDPGSDPSFSYTWKNGTTLLADTTPTLLIKDGGYYHVTIANKICLTRDSAKIEALELPQINKPEDFHLCPGQDSLVDLGLFDKCTYWWSTGAETHDILINEADTFYYVVKTGACQDSGSFITIIDSLPVLNLTDTAICSGDSLIIDVPFIDGVNYLWSDGPTGNYRVFSEEGEYSLLVTHGICLASDKFTLAVNESPQINTFSDTTVCIGKSIAFEQPFSSGNEFIWRTSTDTLSIDFNLLYSSTLDTTHTDTIIVEISNSFGCTVSDSIQASFVEKSEVSIMTDVLNTCMYTGDSVALFTVEPKKYSSIVWYGKTGNELGRNVDTIWVQNALDSVHVIAQNQFCSATDTILYDIELFPNDSLKDPSDTICLLSNGAVVPKEITNKFISNGYVYEWKDEDGVTYLNDPVFRIYKPGMYWVTISNGNRCPRKDSINIVAGSIPTYSLPVSDTLCSGEVFVLPPFPVNGVLDMDSISPDIYPIDTGYAVKGPALIYLRFNNSCGFSEVYTCKIITENCGRTIFFPGGFTPNSDGTNDTFQPKFFGYDLVQVRIVDRWGELVFDGTGTGSQEGPYPWDGPEWDGTYKNASPKVDVYKVFIVASYLGDDGIRYYDEKSGTFSLIK